MPSQHPFFTAAQHVSLVLSAWAYSVYSSVTTSGAVCRYSCWKVVITMFCRLSSCCPSPHNHVNSCKPTNDMRNPPPPLMITAVEKRCVLIFCQYAWAYRQNPFSPTNCSPPTHCSSSAVLLPGAAETACGHRFWRSNLWIKGNVCGFQDV